MKNLLLICLLFVAIIPCKAQTTEALTLDGSSREALEASTKTIKESLGEEKGNEFMMSLFVIVVDEGKKYQNKEEGDAALLKTLDGKTVEQIMAMAKEIAENNKGKVIELNAKNNSGVSQTTE